MAEKIKKKKKMSSDTIMTLTIVGTAVGGIGAIVALYYAYLRGLKKQSAEAMDKTIDKIMESATEDREKNKLAYEVYLWGFLNYICGKSEKVKDALIEEGIIEGEGWGLPVKEEDLTE